MPALLIFGSLFAFRAVRSRRRAAEQWKSGGDYSTLIFPSAPRRGAGVAEQGCLLSSYTPKGCRGFESPPLRHNLKIQALPSVLLTVLLFSGL